MSRDEKRAAAGAAAEAWGSEWCDRTEPDPDYLKPDGVPSAYPETATYASPAPGGDADLYRRLVEAGIIDG